MMVRGSDVIHGKDQRKDFGCLLYEVDIIDLGLANVVTYQDIG